MKKNIGIFFGGRSVEHEISIITASQLIKAIDKSKYEVTPIYISQEGIWYTGSWLNYSEHFRDYKTLMKHCKKVIPTLYPNEGILLSYPSGFLKSSQVVSKIDIAFPVFHGSYGEDGCIQGLFEIMNIPYVGSNVVASAICMNKSLTKEICKGIDIPIIKYYQLDSDLWFHDKELHLTLIEKEFSYPLIVKPNNLGSSIGVSRASNINELENAIDLAAAYSNDIIVEICVLALKEVNCSIAETLNGVEVSECEEPIISSDNLLTFDEKYLSSGNSNVGMAGTKRKIPAILSDSLQKDIKEYSTRIYTHLGCSGIVRIDFIIDISTGLLYLNEINTIPGSLAFYLWEASGKKFSDIITEIILVAEKRFIKNNRTKKIYTSNILFRLDGSKFLGK